MSDPSRQDRVIAAKRALSQYMASSGRLDSGRPLGLVRRIALLALYSMRTERLPLDRSLGVAAAICASETAVTAAYLKKCKSEARAMLLEVGAADLAGADAASPAEMFRTVERLIETSLAGATRRRASTLQGAKGGRRAKGAMPLLRAVRELAARARLGDPRAAAELQAITSYLAAGEPAAAAPGGASPQARPVG